MGGARAEQRSSEGSSRGELERRRAVAGGGAGSGVRQAGGCTGPAGRTDAPLRVEAQVWDGGGVEEEEGWSCSSPAGGGCSPAGRRWHAGDGGGSS